MIPPTRKIHRLLIANRGEIARRIIRSAHALGIETVAVYSDSDRDLPFVAEATHAIPLCGLSPKESYLDQTKILNAARLTKADAIHPGYGFLSENAEFAAACMTAGILWVGPNPESMRALGGKIESKQIAERLHVRTLTSLELPKEEQQLSAFIAANPLPLLIKASGGGGGRGMRVVKTKDELATALKSASSEAESFFNDPRVFIEKFLDTPRHIEVQAIGDTHGNIITLGTRDCTAQRKHQKIIEEAPAAFLPDAIAEEIESATQKLLKEVGYISAATVEFLFDGAHCYFLEVNTRLQVEHPVTEAIFGIDLVALQLQISEGARLDDLIPQSRKAKGHAIELRICAEDPTANFMPSTGRILEWRFPQGPRVDSGFRAGTAVSPHFDSLISKVIVVSESRDACIAHALNISGHIGIAGIKTNLPFLRAILQHPDFISMNHSVRWAEGVAATLPTLSLETAAAIFCSIEAMGQTPRRRAMLVNGVLTNPIDQSFLVTSSSDGTIVITEPGGKTLTGMLIYRSPASTLVIIEGDCFHIDPRPISKATAGDALQGTLSREIRSPLPGKIVAIHTQSGAAIKKGDVLITLESMKMEHPVVASEDGVVKSIAVIEKAIVEARSLLLILE